MKAPTSVLAANLRGDARMKIAAAGDVHCSEELVGVLREAGVVVLERSHTVIDPRALGRAECLRPGRRACRLGVAGVKGFVGGFLGMGLPDFGERSLRAIYAETGDETHALSEGLHEIALCPFRIA